VTRDVASVFAGLIGAADDDVLDLREEQGIAGDQASDHAR
jgi:hypothetical protein